MTLEKINQPVSTDNVWESTTDCLIYVGEVLGFEWSGYDYFHFDGKLVLPFEDFFEAINLYVANEEKVVYQAFWDIARSRLVTKFDRYLDRVATNTQNFLSLVTKDASINYLFYRFADLVKDKIKAYLPESETMKNSQKNALSFFDEQVQFYYTSFKASEFADDVYTEDFPLSVIMDA